MSHITQSPDQEDPLAIAHRWKDEPLSSYAPLRTLGILSRALLAAQRSGPDSDAQDAARYRWFRACGQARQVTIAEYADQPYLLDHHIDKGMCGL